MPRAATAAVAPRAAPKRARAPAAPTAPAAATPARPAKGAATATLTLSSKNYSSWSLRGWLMVKFAGIGFTELMVEASDPDARQEILLLSPSILVPALTHHDGRQSVKVWDTLAIGEYLAEVAPRAGLLPADRAARAHCRAICGEMHSGFASLRASLPMNLKGDFPRHKVWSRAVADIERISEIWRECLARYGGPYLFGRQRCMADAMYAPVATRFTTYHVVLDPACAAYCRTIYAMPEMQAWIAQARLEADDFAELDMDF